jgi:hypothetical protein
MAFKDRVAPKSMDQIVVVVLLWAILILGSARLFRLPLLRWEVILSTIIMAVWTIWAIQYRLEQARQDRHQ